MNGNERNILTAVWKWYLVFRKVQVAFISNKTSKNLQKCLTELKINSLSRFNFVTLTVSENSKNLKTMKMAPHYFARVMMARSDLHPDSGARGDRGLHKFRGPFSANQKRFVRDYLLALLYPKVSLVQSSKCKKSPVWKPLGDVKNNRWKLQNRQKKHFSEADLNELLSLHFHRRCHFVTVMTQFWSIYSWFLSLIFLNLKT